MQSLLALYDSFPPARTGLSAAEASASRERFGGNRLTQLPREPVWRKFLGKFDEPIIRILLGASLLKIVVDLFARSPLAGGLGLGSALLLMLAGRRSRLREWLPALFFTLAMVLFWVSVALGHPSVEGLAVMVAVALATGVAFLSEHRSDREFEALNHHKEGMRVRAIRAGSLTAIPPDDVAVGDRIFLEAGDEIPADGRMISGHDFRVDQSLLTGESDATVKRPDSEDDAAFGPEHDGCLYRGTHVVDGSAEMAVVQVGDQTMMGQIALRLGSVELPNAGDVRVKEKLAFTHTSTPLQEKLAQLAGAISKVGYAAALAIVLALLVRGLFVVEPREVFWPSTNDELLRVVAALLGYVVYMVIVIVVAVPEGLPMSVTVSLALAMRKMTRANSLVKQLVACETIGSASVICTDKTGTLTQNRMTVARWVVLGEALAIPSSGLALQIALNSTASLGKKEGNVVVLGNSTEGALLRWIAEAGFDAAELRTRNPILSRSAFSSESKEMTSLVERDGQRWLLCKGAPELVLARCNRIGTTSGEVLPLTPEDRETILADLHAAAGEAMRTLAFAEDPRFDTPHQDSGLIFRGFVAIRDPLRPGVREAIAGCRAAGIDVKMITGDNPETARAIAREIGLLDSPDAKVLTSAEFNAMSDGQLKVQLKTLRVLARARPLDKFRLVGLLQAQGEVVAMTGDGTNDAPSLKKADVGLAMGIAGSEVAKEASKIVLLDDAFGTIVQAVHWGRALYENIQRFILFQLTINASALAIAFLGPLIGLKPPFTVLQLLWINVIMDTFAAIALCSEPPRPGLMREPPKRRSDNIITRAMLLTILSTGTFFVVAMMGLLLGMEYGSWFQGDGAVSEELRPFTLRQVTIFFTVYVLFQVWNQINCRSLTPLQSAWNGLHRNRLFLMISGITLFGQVLIVHFGGAVFDVEPLALLDWLGILGVTASVLIYAETIRRVRRWLGTKN